MYKLLYWCCTTFLLLLTIPGYASHIQGLNLHYEYLGGDQYWVEIHAYRYCDTSAANFGSLFGITVFDSCGTNTWFSLPRLDSIQVNPQCPGSSLPTVCMGGPYPGVEFYRFGDTISIDPPQGNCSELHLAWYSCCRNPGIVNINQSSGQPISVQAIKDFSVDSTNSSPVFIGPASTFFCSNQVNQVSGYAYDPDGDSLVYELVAVTGGNTTNQTPLSYVGGFTGTVPIDNASIDPATGTITFGPVITAGQYSMGVKVYEYDGMGNLKGTNRRDINFTVEPCVGTNQPPVLDTASVAVSGSGFQVNTFGVFACTGDSFCLEATFTDPDTSDTLYLTHQIDSILPGATVTITGTNPLTMKVCWTALPPLNGPRFFTVSVSDDFCPLVGTAMYTFSVDIPSVTLASQDVSICVGDTVSIQGVGVPPFNWSSLSGDPISVGVNIGCDTCASTWASPTQTTSYLFTSASQGGCASTDTVTVFVQTDLIPDYDLVWLDPLRCLADTGLVTTDLPNPSAYQYTWSTAAATITDSSQAIAEISSPPIDTFQLVLELQQGSCFRIDTFDVVQSNGLITNDILYLCSGDSVTYVVPGAAGLNVVWLNGPPYVVDQFSDSTIVAPIFDVPFLISISDNNCQHNMTLQTFVGNLSCVEGIVSNEQGFALNNSLVTTYELDTNNQPVILQTDSTNSIGFYELCNVPEFKFYIKVDPDPILHPNHITTYYEQEFLSQHAVEFHSVCTTEVIDISTIALLNTPSGPGSLGGKVQYGAGWSQFQAGDPVPGLKIFLVNPTEEPIQLDLTDGQGAFQFADLPLDSTYLLHIEQWATDNQPAPSFTLTQAVPNRDNLLFELFSDRLEYLYPLAAIEQTKAEGQLKCYPNPSSGMVLLEWNAAEMLESVTVEVWTLMGQRLSVQTGMRLQPHEPLAVNLDVAEGGYLLRVLEKDELLRSLRITVLGE